MISALLAFRDFFFDTVLSFDFGLGLEWWLLWEIWGIWVDWAGTEKWDLKPSSTFAEISFIWVDSRLFAFSVDSSTEISRSWLSSTGTLSFASLILSLMLDGFDSGGVGIGSGWGWFNIGIFSLFSSFSKINHSLT